MWWALPQPKVKQFVQFQECSEFKNVKIRSGVKTNESRKEKHLHETVLSASTSPPKPSPRLTCVCVCVTVCSSPRRTFLNEKSLFTASQQRTIYVSEASLESPLLSANIMMFWYKDDWWGRVCWTVHQHQHQHVLVWLYVCVCVWETDREGARKWTRERERERRFKVEAHAAFTCLLLSREFVLW